MCNIKKILTSIINIIPFINRYHTRNAVYSCKKMLLHCKIDSKGTNNVIILHEGGSMQHCLLHIRGNDNRIEIGSNTSASNVEFWIEDDCNSIVVGDNTSLCGKAHLACIEGTTIEIGNDCLFSSDIVFRTGDSHSLLDNNGKRINPSKSIKIGNHVWIGHRVLVNKGSVISDNTIVGTGTIVTKQFYRKNVVIAGVPGNVIKDEVTWDKRRL